MPASPPENHVAPAPGADLIGGYWCSIAEGGYGYDRFGCAIRRTDGHLELAKLGGSQRFVGRITPRGGHGFTFSGKLFCPYGACDQPLHGTFAPVAGGELAGSFTDNDMTVTLAPATRGALAAAGYGGASYGGGGYGGNSYGGGTIPTP